MCREKELCFLHCNAFSSVLEQRSMGHMNYFQGWPRRVNVCEVEALIPKALSSVQMSSLVAPGMSAGQQDHNTLPAQLCQNTDFKFNGWTFISPKTTHKLRKVTHDPLSKNVILFSPEIAGAYIVNFILICPRIL